MGVNYQQVPVNRPLALVATYNRDGGLRVDGNGGGGVDYEPNSFGGPRENPSFMEPPLRIDVNAARYTTYPDDDEDLYGRPRVFWSKVLDDQGRANLVGNIVSSMGNPTMGIADPYQTQEQMLRHWYKDHPDMGRRIADGLGLGAMRRAGG